MSAVAECTNPLDCRTTAPSPKPCGCALLDMMTTFPSKHGGRGTALASIDPAFWAVCARRDGGDSHHAMSEAWY